MVDIKLRYLLIIGAGFLLVVFFLGAGQDLGTSSSFSSLPTDVVGEGTDNTAFVYSMFTMCPLRFDLIDPTDTVWNVDYNCVAFFYQSNIATFCSFR